LPVATATNRKIPIALRRRGCHTLDPNLGRTFPVAAERTRIGSKVTRKEIGVSSTIDVKSARIPDRDKLLELLREHGLKAEPHDELGIEVQSDDDGGELFGYVERLVMLIGAPFVPTKHENVIYIRPPVG
jgi:hypothetical protein